MAPVNSTLILPYPQRVHSIDESDVKKVEIVRQNSASFPEQQDAKEISTMEEWKQSLTLQFTAALLQAEKHVCRKNDALPVEHPLSPQKEGKVDHWGGVTSGLDDETVLKRKSKPTWKTAVEHELDEEVNHVVAESDTYLGQKTREKSQGLDVAYLDMPMKNQQENGEKRGITCTEDSYPEQQLVVDLPPPSMVDTVSELASDEQNINNDISDVRVCGEENTDITKYQTKEVNLPRRSPRRHEAGKAKRNQYFVTDPSPPPAKRRKKAKGKLPSKKAVLNCEDNEELPETLAKTQTTIVEEIKIKPSVRKTSRNFRTRQNHHRSKKQQVTKGKQIETPRQDYAAEETNQIALEREQLIKRAETFMFLPLVENNIGTQKNYHTHKKSREKNEGVSDSETGDSGVDSGGSGSLEGHGGGSGEGGGGNIPGGGNGDGGGGDIGGWRDKDKGQDDDDDGEKQRWRNGGQLIDDSEEEKMETDEDEEFASDTQLDNKAPVGIQPVVGSATGGGTPKVQETQLENRKTEPFRVPVYALQDVRHAAYCRMSGCPNQNCGTVKSEWQHLAGHNSINSCQRCNNCHKVITEHAKTCPMPSCRVPLCFNLKKDAKKPKPQPVTPVVPQPALQPYLNIGIYQPGGPPPPVLPIGQYSTPHYIPNVNDGRVLVQNSNVLPPEGGLYQESIDYHVQRDQLLGKGTNGNVYLVHAKTSLSSSSSDHKEMAMKETKYKIGYEEVKVYKTLGTDHENIVAHHGVTFKGSNGHACIFMEKCDKSLWHVLCEKPVERLDVEEAIYYGCQVIEAVDYMHSKSVIHRDIKAKNVMLSKDQDLVRAKLGDMDSAKLLEDEFTESGLRPVGTPGFAAQEVRNSQPHGRPADIYSVGCFMLELTVGVPSGDTLPQKIEMLRQKDPELAEIVERCVTENFALRPTAKELLRHPRILKYKMPKVLLEV